MEKGAKIHLFMVHIEVLAENDNYNTNGTVISIQISN